MRPPASLKWIVLALLGLLIATAVALAATSLISRQIGIDSESITAGDTLAPAFQVKAEPEPGAEADAEEEPGPEGEPEPRTETGPPPETEGESSPPTEPAESGSDDGEAEGGGGGEGADD
jgi:hypothetical protein